MADINELLARLKQVKKSGASTWKACCPAHDDRSPSMSIKETPEGAILIHCFAGCSVPDIVASVGLELSDLFPAPLDKFANVVKGNKHAFNARDAVAFMAKESLFVAACCVVLREQGFLPEKDKDRLMSTSGRLMAIADEVL
jgi:hypothetical protein